MATVTLSSKHQITLPVAIVRNLDLKPGDKLIALDIDWRIVLMKESENTVERLKGSMTGVYGSTLQEIDAYIAEERRSPERDEWREQFYDLVATDEDVRQLVKVFRAAPHGLRALDELETSTTIGLRRVNRALEKLQSHGSVRRTHITKLESIGERQKYRLVHEFFASR